MEQMSKISDILKISFATVLFNDSAKNSNYI